MINFMEYAEIAADVYNLNSLFSTNNFNLHTKHSILEDTHGWRRVTDVATSMLPTNHFFAALYIKFDQGVATDAVVAVRGTVFNDWTNLAYDAYTWMSDVLGDGSRSLFAWIARFFPLIIPFVREAQDYLDHYFPSAGRLHVTGHSLGGAIAQLVSLQANLAHPVVAFNAPGVGHLRGVQSNKKGWVHHINAKYGFINKIGATIGKIDWVDVKEREEEAKQLFAYFNPLSYQKANSMQSVSSVAAFMQRFSALMHSTGAASSWPAVVKNQAACHGAVTYPEAKAILSSAYTPMGLVGDTLSYASCTESAVVAEVIDVIFAQHAISHLVNALRREEYQSLAYQTFFSSATSPVTRWQPETDWLQHAAKMLQAIGELTIHMGRPTPRYQVVA